MPEDFENLLRKAERLKELLESKPILLTAPDEYRELRRELLSHEFTKTKVPEVVRKSRSLSDCRDYLSDYSFTVGESTYLRTVFDLLFSELEEQAFAPTNSIAGTNQIFFPQGSEHDAFLEIRKIIQLATKEIMVVDPYVDDQLWMVLTNAPTGCLIQVLTNHMKSDFLLEKAKFASQHDFAVEVRQTRSIHDRFLLIDKEKCWHLGASIKDAGSKAFLISELQSASVILAVQQSVESYWVNAVPQD